jgi:hypothetical protein
METIIGIPELEFTSAVSVFLTYFSVDVLLDLRVTLRVPLVKVKKHKAIPVTGRGGP